MVLFVVLSGVSFANAGWANVRDYGARGDGFTDDTLAIQAALASGRTVYFPAGRYILSDTLSFQNKTLTGDGPQSIIVARIADPKKPILAAGRSSVVERLQLQYDGSLLTGEEAQGERVALRTHGGPNDFVLQRGSTVSNLIIQHVGTGISDGGRGCFSVTFHDIEIKDFSFRGWDFYGTSRTGNVYSNIYITNLRGAYQPRQGFVLMGQENESSINQLNVEHMNVEQAIKLHNIRALSAGTIHIEGVGISIPNSSFIELSQVAGEISAVSFLFTHQREPGVSLFELKDTGYSMPGQGVFTDPDQLTAITIGTLHVKGLNRPDWGLYPEIGREEKTLFRSEDFNFFYRDSSFDNRNYVVNIERYNWATFPGIADDSSIYMEFPCDPHERITFLKKGEIRRIGPSDARPTQRLVPGMSRYFDTDLGREFLWDGTDWI